jgi:DNA-binding phage protein
MPLTRSFKETVMDRIRRNPDFANGMLLEGITCLLGDEIDIGKDMLRDYINATMGFDGLSDEVEIPPKSLMRMLGPGGNPNASNLLAIIAALQHHAGVELHVTSTPVRKMKKAVRNRKVRAKRGNTGHYREASHDAPRAFAEAGAKFKR